MWNSAPELASNNTLFQHVLSIAFFFFCNSTTYKTWSDWYWKSYAKAPPFGGSHAFARLLTATLGISNSSYVEFNQISIWQFQRSEALKPICFGPIVDSWIFSRERHLFLQKDSMNSRKEHSLHLLYTGHLVICTSKAWRYNEIVLNQTN